MARFNPWGALVALEEPTAALPRLSDPCWGWTTDPERQFLVDVEDITMRTEVEEVLLVRVEPADFIVDVVQRR